MSTRKKEIPVWINSKFNLKDYGRNAHSSFCLSEEHGRSLFDSVVPATLTIDLPEPKVEVTRAQIESAVGKCFVSQNLELIANDLCRELGLLGEG